MPSPVRPQPLRILTALAVLSMPTGWLARLDVPAWLGVPVALGFLWVPLWHSFVRARDDRDPVPGLEREHLVVAASHEQLPLPRANGFDLLLEEIEEGVMRRHGTLLAEHEIDLSILPDLSNDDLVEISSKVGSGTIKAYVTDMIHPEAVFMVHGFGHEAKLAARCYNKGVSDSVLQENITDRVGGSPAFHDTFVTVKAA